MFITLCCLLILKGIEEERLGHIAVSRLSMLDPIIITNTGCNVEYFQNFEVLIIFFILSCVLHFQLRRT